MKTWFVFDVTNYLGFTKRISVWVNNTEEGIQKIKDGQEYPPKEIKYIGNTCYDRKLSDTVDEVSYYGMSAVDMMIANRICNLFAGCI